jgi:WS/DGAT/MGAT family acyltransferase
VADELSPSDRASLAAERGPVNMAVAGALVFDGGPGVERAAVVERLRSRLHLIPRYRQKLAESLPGGLTQPVWVDDTAFDLDWHIRQATLPAPGGDAELGDFMGRELSRRLDRSRPLWELHVVDGLAGGRVALVPKMHHALVDGVAAVDVGTVLLDPSEEPVQIEGPEEWEPRSYDRRRHLARVAATPFVRAQRLMLDTATRALDTSPRKAAEDLRRATELATELARTRPQAPMTSLNRPISPNRRYAVVRASLAPLKAAGKAAGGTVNDALLAAVAGMLRGLFSGTAAIEGEPVALVPVSVRRSDEQGELGNHISTVFVDLPVHEADPVARLQRISRTMAELKQSAAVRAGAMIVGATGWAPPAISAMMVRAMGGVRACNLVVSNVPGPQQPFYINGLRLREVFPAVPLNPPNQGLSVGILSYDGGVYFGLLADRELVPPVQLAAAMLADSVAELTGPVSAP